MPTAGSAATVASRSVSTCLAPTLARQRRNIGRDVFRVGAQLDVMRFDELVGGFLAYDGRFQENAQNNTFSGGILVRF